MSLRIVAAALAFGLACGPLGPFPGGVLSGTLEPVPESWDFARGIETAQLETRPEDPHSINIWTGVHAGSLYVATSLILGVEDPAERDWVRHVQADPRVRLKLEDALFELRAVRVEDPAEREAARAVLMAKYDVEPDERTERAWVFRLDPR